MVPSVSGKSESGIGSVETLSGLSRHLCRLLCSDFYRPFSLGRIYNELFPLEIFDPAHDNHRVYEIIRRCNHLLRREFAQLRIAAGPQGYSMTSTNPVAVVIPENAKAKSQSFEMILWSKARNLAFSAKETQEWTQTPLTTTIRKLNGLMSMGLIEKKSSGKNTLYQFRKRPLLKAG